MTKLMMGSPLIRLPVVILLASTIVDAFLLLPGRHPSGNAAWLFTCQATNSVDNSSVDRTKLIRQTDYLRGKTLEPPVTTNKLEQPTSTRGIDDENLNKNLLQEALVSFDSESAKKLLDIISSLRSKDNNQELMSALLNNLLADGPDASLPLWSRWRFLSRFSKRARWASLRRTLDLTTPPPNVEDDEEDTVEDQQRRRRRALVSLLRTLSNPADTTQSVDKTPAIVSIERQAKMGKKSKSLGDMRNRLPPGLETPKYDILSSGVDGYEIRRYEPFSVCSVEMNKPRPVDAYRTDATISEPTKGSAQAFGALAGYLFGKNQQGVGMKMTTPVINRGEADSKTMSFVLPSEFWTNGEFSAAPQPLEGSGVVLEQMETENRAVMMFGGYASKKEVELKKRQLLDLLENDKEWSSVDELVALLQYNDPFTPPWKRLNEVSVAVKRK